MSINVNSLDDIVYVITNEDEVVYLTTIPNDIGQSPIQFQEEGVNVGVAGSVNTIDFVGATVTISQVGGKLTVTITSAGGGVTAVGNLTPLFTASIAGVTMSFAQIVKAANLIFAGPATGADANPDFRALVAADIPGSTVGLALLALTNPSAVSYPRINADNTVTALTLAQLKADLVIDSGTWTPTITNGVNLDANTPQLCYYSRVGNIVTFGGGIALDPTTAAGTTTSFEMSLPIASDFTNVWDASGYIGANAGTTQAQNSRVFCDVTNNTIKCSFFCSNATNQQYTILGTYIIK